MHASETTPAKTPPEPWMMGAATAVSIRALIIKGILDLILVGGLILVLTTRVRLAIRRGKYCMRTKKQTYKNGVLLTHISRV